MHVICTQCQFKGVIDVPATAASEVWPVCARCGSTLERQAQESEEHIAQPVAIFDAASRRVAVEPARSFGVEQTIQDFKDLYDVRRSSLLPARDVVPQVPAVEQSPSTSFAVEPAPEKTVAPQSQVSQPQPNAALKQQERPSPQKSWFARRPSIFSNLFRSRSRRKAFPTRDKYFLLRISPVIVLSCMLIYLSFSALSDLVARSSGAAADKSGQQRQLPNAGAPAASAGDREVQSAAAPSTTTAAAAPAVAAAAAPPAVAPAAASAAAPVEIDSEEDGRAAALDSFTIQVGSYADSEQANAQCARLNSAGIESRMVRAEIPGRGTWYRVQAGHFASRAEATRYGAQLQAARTVQRYIVTAAETP